MGTHPRKGLILVTGRESAFISEFCVFTLIGYLTLKNYAADLARYNRIALQPTGIVCISIIIIDNYSALELAV
jgi:hypothetical protein